MPRSGIINFCNYKQLRPQTSFLIHILTLLRHITICGHQNGEYYGMQLSEVPPPPPPNIQSPESSETRRRCPPSPHLQRRRRRRRRGR